MENKHDLAKWLAGEMSAEELHGFKRTPEFETYERIARFSSQLETPAFEEDAMYQNIMSRDQRPVKVIRFYQATWFKVAAAIILLVGLAVTIVPTISETETAGNAAQFAFALPDDSEVILNAGSSAEYKKWNWSNNREVALDAEAFFKVAKGKTFDVKTDLGTVTVVGTQFNVKARDNRLEVECFEGKVKVKIGNREKLLLKGDILVAENGEEIRAASTRGGEPCWLKKEICFNSTSLTEIIKELERQYNITITQKDLVANGLFTGIIPADNLEKSLAIISKTFNFKFKISKNTVTLYPDE